MKLSVVIPAFNEEGLLPACLESVQATLGDCAELDLELIVVDNNSTDRTSAVAEQGGARVVFEGVNQIARARNSGAAAGSGDWLLFLDADSRLNAGLADQLMETIRGGDAVACGAVMRMPGLPWWARGLIGSWNATSRLCRWAAGSFLACRTDAFRALRGFDQRLYAAEEIDLSRRLKRWARPQRLRFRIFYRYPLETSPRKLELYTGREIAAQFGRLLTRPWRALRNPEALALWYDGRR
jgi:glycosyltransferase involved in cell wall biosynthesis